MASVAPINVTSSALQELQKAFCLLKLSGDVVIVDQKQIEGVRSGIDREGVQMFRMTPGKLLLRRFLEALPLSSDPARRLPTSWSARTQRSMTGSPSARSRHR
jgi:hypothetical protein